MQPHVNNTGNDLGCWHTNLIKLSQVWHAKMMQSSKINFTELTWHMHCVRDKKQVHINLKTGPTFVAF